jgi:hypothetical protein
MGVVVTLVELFADSLGWFELRGPESCGRAALAVHQRGLPGGHCPICLTNASKTRNGESALKPISIRSERLLD